jgi:uncharacterized protein YecE (DUF72 family)
MVRQLLSSKLAAKNMLAYYATQLPVVEINNTFYQLPKAALLELGGSRCRQASDSS